MSRSLAGTAHLNVKKEKKCDEEKGGGERRWTELGTFYLLTAMGCFPFERLMKGFFGFLKEFNKH